MHTKISHEYVIKKRWLTGLLSRFAYKNHTKISRAYTAIKRCLRTNLGQSHIQKISGEYPIKKTLV